MTFEHEKGWAQLVWGAWYLTIFFHPRSWALDYHRNAPCCKWWLLIGPFELNRVWTDEDDYPFNDEDDDAA